MSPQRQPARTHGTLPGNRGRTARPVPDRGPLPPQRGWGNKALANLARAGQRTPESHAAGPPLRSPPAGGRALPADALLATAAAFGVDLSGVRVHDGPEAAVRAETLDARAYTSGDTIGFGLDRYRPGTPEGARLLGHELGHVIEQTRAGRMAVQLARLQDWRGDRSVVVTSADIRSCTEYQAYMNPALVWQTVHHVTDAEAVQACRYMLAALRNGIAVTWAGDARRYLDRARDYLTKVNSLVLAQETWLAAEAAAGGRTIGEQVHKVAQEGGYGGRPTPWWDGLGGAGQAAWMANAATVIAAVVASVAGTPQERMVAARGITASPKECESYNAYAYFLPSDNKLHVGRDWIAKADSAAGGSPQNVHDNIAHELGGHFEYEQYGPSAADAVMTGVLSRLSAVERTRANAGPKSVFSAYGYIETELFAELREHGLRRPRSGGDLPGVDVPKQLRALKARYAPAVAKAIVTELWARVRATNNISAAAKTLFRTSVEAEFPGLISP